MELIASESFLLLNLLIQQVSTQKLYSIEPNLLVSNLVLPSAIYYVSICDLFCIRPLYIRKDSIFGNLAVNKVLGQAKLAIIIIF
jgi:hypothetical protein